MATYQDYNPTNSPVAQRPGWYDRPQNGGGKTVDSTLPPNKFYGTCVPEVSNGFIAAGQVLKAGTFLIEDSYGNYIAAGNIAETALVTFTTALTAGQTLIMAGLTFTSGASGTTVAQLVEAWSALGKGIPSGTGYAAITTVTNASAGGTFTAGTLTGYNAQKVDANTVAFNAVPGLTNATNIVATGTGTAPTIVISGGGSTFVKPKAVLLYDVDATSAVKACQVYTEAYFWGDDWGGNASFLRWMTDADETVYSATTGSYVPCTAYNTGCYGDTVEMQKLKRMYVSGTEFKVYLSPPHNNVYDPNNNNYVGV